MVCRAALARSKGWAPRSLPGAKQPLPADTAADSTAPKLPSGLDNQAAVKALPWSDPSLHFSSAPVFDGLATDSSLHQPVTAPAAAEDTTLTLPDQTIQVSCKCAYPPEQFFFSHSSYCCMPRCVSSLMHFSYMSHEKKQGHTAAEAYQDN